MEAEDFISKELQSTTDLSKLYANFITELQKFNADKPVETARMIGAMSRGMRRMEKDNKRLNQQLGRCIDQKLEKGDSQYIHPDD